MKLFRVFAAFVLIFMAVNAKPQSQGNAYGPVNAQGEAYGPNNDQGQKNGNFFGYGRGNGQGFPQVTPPPCPGIQGTVGAKTFCIFSTLLTQDQALAQCQADGFSTLLTIETVDEFTQLVSYNSNWSMFTEMHLNGLRIITDGVTTWVQYDDHSVLLPPLVFRPGSVLGDCFTIYGKIPAGNDCNALLKYICQV